LDFLIFFKKIVIFANPACQLILDSHGVSYSYSSVHQRHWKEWLQI